MKRLYFSIIVEHFKHNRQMLFLSGPRQVGKTTVSKVIKSLTDLFVYLNWDDPDDADLIIQGPSTINKRYGLTELRKRKALIVFDEIHKYTNWRNFLKGFFNKYQDTVNIIVTGSANLDLFRRGGDSLMGRYIHYRVHPLSIAECIRTTVREYEINIPNRLSAIKVNAMLTFSGFPEPFTRKEKRFYNQWQQLKLKQLFREELRNLTRIHDLAKLELLSRIIKQQAGQLVNYSNLASKVHVSSETVHAWLEILSSFYYCFTISPWTKNITRSLLKQPKIYLWDWSQITDPGQRYENFVASHLLKAIHFWTDHGLGEFGLYFLRDKEQREVDFLVTKDEKPWFIVEAKLSSNKGIQADLYHFQKQTNAKHAFQVVQDLAYVNADCFSYNKPIVVPAVTFLSQLI